MVTSILKTNWERYRPHVIVSLEKIRQILTPVSSDTVEKVSILSGGCANTNYKIEFKNEPPLVLRIYTRDPAALGREQNIYRLVEGGIPTAKMLFSDESLKHIAHPFAIVSFVDGILLRDLILAEEKEAVSSLYFEVGRQLALFQNFTFPTAGLFEKDLSIRPFAQENAYLNFALTLIKSSSLKRDLGRKLLERVHDIVISSKELLPKNTDAYLTHGDFDPSNIKAKKVNGTWSISGILDWEFAFSGSFYSDMGSMLRYSHKLPSCYETAFLQGICARGLKLPYSWKQQAKLLDLLSLLKIADSNPARIRPIVKRDASELIIHSVDHWHTY